MPETAGNTFNSRLLCQNAQTKIEGYLIQILLSAEALGRYDFHMQINTKLFELFGLKALN